MKIFKPYTNIKDFLYRFTILKIGKLHIRFHKILSADQSTLFHNHPFHYVSIILKNGYIESVIDGNKILKKKHRFLSVICRNRNVYHRIDKIFGETITLFIAFGNYSWKAINTQDASSDDGLYQRTIKGKLVWAKKENGIWFVGHIDKTKAISETRHTIHQVL